MENIDNKNLILEAIDNYDLYIKSCKEVLKAIVCISKDDICIINAKSLEKVVNYTNPVIYKALRVLKKDRILITNDKIKEQKYRFTLNRDKLNEIIDNFLAKQKMLEKAMKNK